MRDLNFFETQIDANSTKKKNKKYYKIIAFTLILMIFISLVNLVSIIVINSNIKSLNNKLSDAEFIKEYSESQTIAKNYNSLTVYNAIVDKLETKIENEKIITTKSLKSITRTIPKEVTVTNMALNDTSVIIQGISNDRDHVAEFQYNLNKIETIGKTTVPSITKGEKGYTFSITCDLKEK